MVRDLKYQIVQNKPEIIWINSKLLEDRIDYDFYSINQIRVVEKLTKVSYRKLDDLVKAKRSEPQTDSKDFSYDGIDVIRMSDIDDFIIDFSNTVKIPIDIYENLKEFTLKPNTVIFGLTGVTLGKAVPISKNIKKCITNRRIAQLEIKDAFDSFYIATFINTQYGRSQLFRYSTGVAQPNIRLEDTGEILVPIPDYDIQKYIGDKVRKAEEWREEAEVLRREAEGIYSLNYEQVKKDKDKFEWVNNFYLNEDNIIPNFYKQYKLLRDKKYTYTEFENITDKIKCGIPVRRDMRIGNTYPFYGASGVTDNIGNYNFNGEYLIVAQDGSIGSVNVARNKFWANNHVWVVKVKSGWDLEFLELYLNQYNHWMSLTTGSVVPKVTSENLKKLLVPKINYEVQKSIGDKIREAKNKEQMSKSLIKQAKQDVEDLIEGSFSMK